MNEKRLFDSIIEGIHAAAAGNPEMSIMEVCGTHTRNIANFGIKQLLPKNIKLVSGPGCPVCVSAEEDIEAAVRIARLPDVILMCFGDMMRVPCRIGSLYGAKEQGSDVRIAVSPIGALETAIANPDKRVVWFAVGFETTAAHTAVLLERALQRGVKNLFVLCSHKTMPQALKKLLYSNCRIDGLLCPGHVAAITGADAFAFVPDELGLPAVISGFSALELVSAIYALVLLIKERKTVLKNMYPSAVSRAGNLNAQHLIKSVFSVSPARWRGMGLIDGSGLSIAGKYAALDAARAFNIRYAENPDEKRGCICSEILVGRAAPGECPNFALGCTPNSPMGPCMASEEGRCSIDYRYGDDFNG